MEPRRERRLGSEFQAGDWLVQPQACRIVGEGQHRRLRPRMMDLLVLLAEHAGEVLTKEEILDGVWGTRYVGESSLTREVAELRRILGDSRGKPRYIETISKRGYRFVAAVPTRRAFKEPRVAVLLFHNLNREPELEYFAEGIADILITELAGINSLRVISRQSVLHYRNSDKSLPAIADELNVDAIVEGSVLHAGSRIRVNAQLVGARPEAHLWARNYDCELGDVLAVQTRVARAVAESVHAALTPQDIARLSRTIPGDPDVHRDYLRARFHTMRWTAEDLQLGLRYLRGVIDKDPTFAPAHELLASSLLASEFWGSTPPRSAAMEAMAAAARAVQLDDSLGEGHATLGLAMMAREPLTAEQELKKAVGLNPSSPFVRLSYALFLLNVRRDPAAAIEQAEAALETDPLSEHTNFSYAWILFFSRQHTRAEEQAARTLEMFRDSMMACYVLGWAQVALGRPADAVVAFERAMALSRNAIGLGYLGHAYGLSGRHDQARAVLSELTERARTEDVPQTSFAYVHLGLRDLDRTFEALDRCLAARDPRLSWFPLTVFCEGVRTDPRFLKLLATLAAGATAAT